MMLKNIHNPSTCYFEIHGADFPQIKAVSKILEIQKAHSKTLNYFPKFLFLSLKRGYFILMWLYETADLRPVFEISAK